ncbi:MAG: pseudouridine synthase [Muribaculaceae bacterium]
MRVSNDNSAAPIDRPRFERVTFNNKSQVEGEQMPGAAAQDGGAARPQFQRQYQRPNAYNNQGGYNQGGYNRPNQYNRPYQQRQPYGQQGEDGEMRPNEGYNRPQGGGYNRPQGGGYNRPQGGGYNRQQGGGYNRPQGGGYNRQHGGQQGGYNRPQGGGYNRQQGGQQGGYNRQQGPYNRPQGPYNNRPNRPQGKKQQGGGVFPGRGKSFTPRPKPIEYEMPAIDPNEQIRLNKFMSNAGICSRREADEFIQQGLVKVNGQVVTELGVKITHNDVVEYDDKVLTLERKCYILLNKPKDCVTTSDDPNGRTTVMDLVKGACNERIYPVGRLDRNTTGVLLLTNDGDLASKLTHPKYVKKKIYHVWTDKDISEDDMQRIADGIELDDGPIHADAISYATETDRNQAGIEIHSGRNRIVRRIFESLGYHVTKLDRVYFAGLTKKNLARGRWRYLTQEEVNLLKMGAFE